jgi:hypothetical protein
MRLVCPQNGLHQKFLRESYDDRGQRVNAEVVDEYGRLVGEPLDLYAGGVRYRYLCLECGAPAREETGGGLESRKG